MSIPYKKVFQSQQSYFLLLRQFSWMFQNQLIFNNKQAINILYYIVLFVVNLLANNTITTQSKRLTYHESIVRFQISVDNVVLVQVIQSASNVQGTNHSVPPAHACVTNVRRKRATRQELCHKAVILICDHRSVEFDDIRRLKFF